jgi:hypothetical protein
MNFVIRVIGLQRPTLEARFISVMNQRRAALALSFSILYLKSNFKEDFHRRVHV